MTAAATSAVASRTAPGDRVLRSTQSICPTCHGVLPAELFVREGDVWIRKTCPEHGFFENLYWPDASLFEEMDRVVGDYVFCKTFECLKGEKCDKCLDKSYNIMIEVTNRCNLDCPVCCSDANNPHSADPTIEQMLERLPPAQPGILGKLQRPNIVLFGGEPTVRKDLPQLIRALVDRGYIPRVATNGVRMTDERYLEQLREAGLKWVILQFDGFDDDVSEQIRGERLQDHKLEAIEKMTAHGFKVQLGTMMVRGLNTRFAGELIRFVGRHEKLFWLSFYPHSAQSRALLPTRDTSMAFMFDEIERQTEGRVRRKDFLSSMRFFSFLYRFLPWPNLRTKLSTMPIILLFEETGEYYAAVRLFEPGFALQHLKMVGKLLAALPKIIRYQEAYTPPFMKVLNVEKFHADESLDLEEASNCHMAFMTSDCYVPFDLYNIAYKKTGAWDTSPTAAKSCS